MESPNSPRSSTWLESDAFDRFKRDSINALVSAMNESEEAGWVFGGIEHGVRIYQKKTSATGACFKGVAVVHAPAMRILHLLMHTEHKHRYDEIFEGFDVVERIDAVTNIERHWYWTPSKRIVKPRDLCILGHACRIRSEVSFHTNDDDEDDGDGDDDDNHVDDLGGHHGHRLAPFSLALVGRSTAHPLCLQRDDFIRAHVEVGGFLIQPLQSLQSDSNAHRDDVADDVADDDLDVDVNDDDGEEGVAIRRRGHSRFSSSADGTAGTAVTPAFADDSAWPSWLDAPRSLVTFVADTDLRGNLPAALSTQLLRKQPQILYHLNKMLTSAKTTKGSSSLISSPTREEIESLWMNLEEHDELALEDPSRELRRFSGHALSRR